MQSLNSTKCQFKTLVLLIVKSLFFKKIMTENYRFSGKLFESSRAGKNRSFLIFRGLFGRQKIKSQYTPIFSRNDAITSTPH